MIFIVLLLVSLFQGVFCGLLARQTTTGCFVMQNRPTESECRSVIDAFHNHAAAGYITVDVHGEIKITKGNCLGTLSNRASSPFKVNADTLKVLMTNYILYPCVLNEQWGFYETDDYVIKLEHWGAGDPKEGGVRTVEEE